MSLHERKFAFGLHMAIFGLFILAFVISALTGGPLDGPTG